MNIVAGISSTMIWRTLAMVASRKPSMSLRFAWLVKSGKKIGGDGEREDALGQLEHAERLLDHGRSRVDDPGGQLERDPAAPVGVDDVVEVDRAEADHHGQHRHHDRLDRRIPERAPETEPEPAVVAKPRDREQRLHHGAHERAPGVDLDAIPIALDERGERHQDRDADRIEGELGEGGRTEPTVGIEDADDHATEAHQHHDRSHDPEQVHCEVELLEVVVDRDVDEEVREHHRQDRQRDHQDEQRAGNGACDTPRALLVAVVAHLGEDRHERAHQRLVRHEQADDDRDLRRDGESRHDRADTEDRGYDHLAREASDLRHHRRDHDDQRGLARTSRCRCHGSGG